MEKGNSGALLKAVGFSKLRFLEKLVGHPHRHPLLYESFKSGFLLYIE